MAAQASGIKKNCAGGGLVWNTWLIGGKNTTKIIIQMVTAWPINKYKFLDSGCHGAVVKNEW